LQFDERVEALIKEIEGKQYGDQQAELSRKEKETKSN